MDGRLKWRAQGKYSFIAKGPHGVEFAVVHFASARRSKPWIAQGPRPIKTKPFATEEEAKDYLERKHAKEMKRWK